MFLNSIIPDKYKKPELDEETIKNILENQQISEKERRKLKLELLKRQLKKKPPKTN